jgi:hypothetical protein
MNLPLETPAAPECDAMRRQPEDAQDAQLELLRNIQAELHAISSQLRDIQRKPGKRRQLLEGFAGGISRGLGMTVGVTLVATLLVYLLRLLIDIDIPVIGEFVARIIKIVQAELTVIE